MTVDFGKVHPRQLSNMLKWLKKMRQDIDGEIRALEAQQASAVDDEKRNLAFKRLMVDLISENLTKEQAENRLIEMGYRQNVVREAQKILRQSAKRKRRRMRDAEIFRRVAINHEDKSALAAEYKISRTHLHRILDKEKPPLF